jgi:hypothetical protein
MTRDELAKTLDGVWSGCWLNICGHGHKKGDHSLGVFFDTNAPDGFRVHSFAGDDQEACRV